MIFLNCSNCNGTISESSNLCFYEKTGQTIFLTVKYERTNAILDKLSIVEEPNSTKQQYDRNSLHCAECNSRLGSESYSGPKGEPIFRFKPKAICLNGQHFRKTQNWTILEKKFDTIDKRSDMNFYGIYDNQNNFTKTVLPNLNEACKFNIGASVVDTPKFYQLECYLSALTSNVIICLPSNAEKTLIATMVRIIKNAFS